MRKVVGNLLIICFVLNIVLSIQGISVNAEDIKQTEVSEYALSFNGNKNIPYVWGGGRNSGETLERLASKDPILEHPGKGGCSKKNRCVRCKATGTDCSGFTSLVYKHFGITIPAQSSQQKASAKKVFTNIKDAVPGDIVWWEGHVAIYIGDEKIVHTSRTDPPNNYPHVTSVWCLNETRGKPTFLRMVDDVDDLKPLTEKKSIEVTTEVKKTAVVKDIIVESDLTGVVIADILLKDQDILPDITELTDKEKLVLEEIKSDIMNRDSSWLDTLRVIVVFSGLVCILYGILLVVAYLFDTSNNIIDISLLRILTLGRYRLWDSTLGVSPGYNKLEGVMYCNVVVLIKRVILVEIIGFILVGGFSMFL